MEGNMANDELEALKQTRDAKFDEICSLLAFAYGEDPDPDNLSDARKINQIIEEAEKLLKRPTVLGNWDVVTKTKLQRLVAEHHEISKHISRRIRAASEELVKRGVLVDSGKRHPRNGEIIWTLNPNLTEKQRQALVEEADEIDN
jgi:hypothetical protein